MAAAQLQRVIDDLNGLDNNESLFNRWCEDISKIGTTACIDPEPSSHEAMEGLAITLGTYGFLTDCIV